MEVIMDLRTLKGMAAKGHITLARETGCKVRHWTGQTVVARYVDNAAKREWEYKGIKYRLHYFDGCFCPFVVRSDAVNLPKFA